MQNVYLVLASQSGIRSQKGRTSQELVVERFGKEGAASYVSQVVMNRALPRVLDKGGIDIVGRPTCWAPASIEEGSAFLFEVQAVKKPTLSLRSYDPVELDEYKEVASSQEIEDFMGELFSYRCQEEPDLSKLDDRWVDENIQGCTTVNSLRARIRAELEERKGQERRARCCRRSAAQLGERLEGAISDVVFEARYAELLQAFRASIAEQGLSEEKYFESQHTTPQEFKVRLMSQTREQLRQELALDALVRHLGMDLESDDLAAYYHAALPGKEEYLKAEAENSGGIRAAEEAALRFKANNWLVDHAVYLPSDEIR